MTGLADLRAWTRRGLEAAGRAVWDDAPPPGAVRARYAPARLSALLPYRYWDEPRGLFVQERPHYGAPRKDAPPAISCGWVLETLPLMGADETLSRILSELFNDAAPAGSMFGATGLLALFAARGLAVGLSDTFIQAEKRARAVTVAGVALGVAMTLGVLFFARPARADDYCARDLGTWFYCVRPEPPPDDSAREEAGTAVEKPAEIVALEAFQIRTCAPASWP